MSEMRKVILGLAVSVDGFIEGPNGEYDWCFTDQDYGLSHFLKGIDTLFIGRKTYELILSAGDKAGAGFPKMKEYIFSTTLKRVKDGATLIRGDIKSAANLFSSNLPRGYHLNSLNQSRILQV